MMKISPLPLLLPALLLGACTHPNFREDTTRNQIESELRQARAQKIDAEATEKALLPPLAVIAPTPAPVAAPKEPRFDLSVVDAPAPQVFMAIVSGTRYNMLVAPGVSGHITINLNSVTVREALDSIRELYGYEYRISGNRISIQPNTLQSRVFQINYLAAQRVGQTDLSVTSSAIGSSGSQAAGNMGGFGGTAMPNPAVPSPTGGVTPNSQMTGNVTTHVRTTTKNDFWESLDAALKTLIGTEDGRNVVITPTAGVVLVRAMPSEIRAVENYLRTIQAIADRQVMLEAKIIEVTLNDSFQAGVNWASFKNYDSGKSHGAIGNLQPGAGLAPTGGVGGALGNGNVTVLPGVAGGIVTAANSATNAGFFGLALQTAHFAALLDFLETQGSVSVLSSPRVATINNQKAVLKVGTDELYVTNVTTNMASNIGSTTLAPSVTLQPYFSGISLDVTPQIDEDDNIVLHIHPAVSTVEEKEKLIDLGAALGQFKLPLAASTVNESDSVVRARDGLIVAIGGLMSQTSIIDRSGLPGTLGSDAGTLVGQRGRSGQKREIVILIKPTLIKNFSESQQDIEAASERIEAMGY
ncbi:MAG: secretin N-terminal domain-containing protein [Azonexus sp.]|jgi:MSHA biogenesis protein MshL|nr:secretin N-terminal domain-containing protein [Azonexus sp.]